MQTETARESAVSTWSIDPAHSSIQFKVRHMMIAWVRGEFRVTKGSLSMNLSNVGESQVEVEIDAASINSGEPKRDEHLRNPDFLDVERFPSIHFQSNHVRRESADVVLVAGNLTICGVTQPVELRVTEISQPTPDPWGNVRAAASATAKVNRKDFGLTWNTALETGGFLVGDEIRIELEVEFVQVGK